VRTLKNPAAWRLGLRVSIAAGATLALAACSSGSSSGSAGASGSGSSGSTPSWAAALGPGTTVTLPRSVTPGHDSPGAAVLGYVNSLTDKDPKAACGYAEPSEQSACASSFAQASKDQLPYGRNMVIGYVATHGTQALVGITGTLCSPGSKPECATNTNPAAVLSSGKSFASLWSQAQSSSSSSNSYAPAPCVEVSGKWYLGV
jgi:hypothetical protein